MSFLCDLLVTDSRNNFYNIITTHPNNLNINAHLTTWKEKKYPLKENVSRHLLKNLEICWKTFRGPFQRSGAALKEVQAYLLKAAQTFTQGRINKSSQFDPRL